VRSDQLPLDRNPAAVYLASLGQGSRRTMRWALDNVADLLTAGRCDALTLDWSQLHFQHVAAVRSRLIEEYAPSTVNKHLSAIRGTLKAAYKLGYIGGEQYRKATDVNGVKNEAEPAGRMLSAQELAALLRACTDDPSPAGARDAAMIALWAVAGPRRAEIVNLDTGHYDPQTGAVRIRKAKGNKDRTVYIANEARQAMDDWLAIRGPIEGPLFVPVHQTGKMRISRMTPQSVYDILQKRAAEARVINVSPHDLRRTAISNLIDATDLSTAQKIAGHADPKTTARYDRRGERAKQQAAAKLSLAYRRIR
jgi:integrase